MFSSIACPKFWFRVSAEKMAMLKTSFFMLGEKEAKLLYFSPERKQTSSAELRNAAFL